MDWLIRQAWFQGAALGCVGGLIGAMRIDYKAFTAWKTWHEGAIYDWRTASLRWVQGAIGGAIGGAPAGSLLALFLS
jgi:hypothetical protein